VCDVCEWRTAGFWRALAHTWNIINDITIILNSKLYIQKPQRSLIMLKLALQYFMLSLISFDRFMKQQWKVCCHVIPETETQHFPVLTSIDIECLW